jgi:hypothetical protein
LGHGTRAGSVAVRSKRTPARAKLRIASVQSRPPSTRDINSIEWFASADDRAAPSADSPRFASSEGCASSTRFLVQ